MYTLSNKNYEITDIEEIVPTSGSFSQKLFRLSNVNTGKKFCYDIRISSTLMIQANIVTDDLYFQISEPYILEYLKKKVEKDSVIKISTFDEEERKRKKDLGSFYTDRKIVEFIYDVLLFWKNDEDKKKQRWQNHDKGPHFPSVIDPAVGEGAFLKVAIEKNFTNHNHIFGLDIDSDAVNKWPDTHLLSAFDNKMSLLKVHFLHQNGLDKIHWEQHKKYYESHLKKADVNNQQFDAVVGNPPYGGSGLEFNQLNDSLIQNIKSFGLLPKDIRNNLAHSESQGTLGFFQDEKKDKLSQKARERLKSFPIEVLFIERFIQLAKPGGWIAMIIPDGILANSNMHNVREFISKKTKVNAVVSLPRDAFKNVGTNAKTSILFLQKLKKEADLEKDLDYSVFLASVAGMDHNNFEILLKLYKNFFEKGVLND